MPSCLIYPEWNWTEHVFVFGGIDLIFFDVIGLGKSKFLFFEANKAIRQDLGNLARFWQSGKILAIGQDFGNLAIDLLKIFCSILPN